jgi:hypothetical protein
MANTTIPIKRCPSLAGFSREHHSGLLLVWKIRQGLKNKVEPARITKYILFFFQDQLAAHFKEEEETLFVKLPVDDPLRKQAFKEHAEIRELVARLPGEPENEILQHQFADALDNHIRFEERILFNHLQDNFTEEELKGLEKHHHKPGADPDDSWDDHFWR